MYNIGQEGQKMKRFIVVLAVCVSLVAGGTLSAHAGDPKPLLSTYVYDSNMARYLDIDMDSLDEKPEVECIVISYSVTPTNIHFRSQIGTWRILADWPARSRDCSVMVWQDPAK
jgi:hypothetical protein